MGNTTSSSPSGNGNGPRSSVSLSSASGISSSININSLSSLRRTTGSLGLSKTELDKRCKPSGLYPTCPWDEKVIRRLIGDGRLAARQVGVDERIQLCYHECPICFLHYSQINMTSCCKAYICTECYLQIRPQKEKDNICPYCTEPNMSIVVAKDLTDKELKKKEEEEQRVIEAQIRAQKSMSENDSDKENEFGKSLEKLRRLRSDSTMSGSSEGSDRTNSSAGSNMVVAMSADERKELEDEMKKQHLHPLARQIEREAEERRREHDQNYRRTNGSRLNRFGRDGSGLAASLHRSLLASRREASRGHIGGRRRERDWNQIVEAFESRGGEVQSLDDLVVIEAAILLSMEEEAAQRRRQRQHRDRNADERGGHDDQDFDVAQHARAGFPLLHSMIARRAHNAIDEDDDTDAADDARIDVGMPPRRGRRPMRNRIGFEDTATLLMRGISEEDQIAMAIALSLRDSDGRHQTHTDAQRAPTSTTAHGTDYNNHVNPQTDGESSINTANLTGASG